MDTRLKYLVLASLMATLTAVGAQIRVPILAVPFTLQTLFVLLAGSLLGPIWGSASMLIYLSMGLLGLPVFAGISGPAAILGPTFGYLASFPICAFWVGKRLASVNTHNVKMLKMVLIFLEGQLWVFALGALYLWFITNYYIGGSLSLGKAIMVGFVIFIPSAIIKTVAAAGLTIQLKKTNRI